MAAGSGDLEYLEALENEVLPVIRSFSPEIILISCGFDAHERDPLANMRLTSAAFRQMTEMLIPACQQVNAPIISFLEGGYDLQGLTEGLIGHLQGLMLLAAG